MAKVCEDSDQHLALFNKFCDSTSFVEILRLFEELCGVCSVDHHQYHGLVQELKQKLSSWKCLDIFKIFETKANHPVYKKQKCCEGMRCLVIGAGPVGLRSAIEAALLGAKVDVVEKRDDFSRNNVLHLWPFLLTDLRNLGTKKFYGKFCSGDLDHISIRMLQAVLLKAALLLGVKVHPSVEFKSVIEPAKGKGWKVGVSPSSCPVSNYEFDMMMGADGKKYVLPGFRTKEFRPKLAIAITANYVNHGTQEEAKVQEISGISYVYHQDFFNRLSEEHGIELENVVYYRDETHYFVMTPKKQSLLQRGVLKQDNTDVKQLLSPSNISPQALKQYAKEVAVYSTKGGFRMESLEFEKNHRGEDDVALFDFTSLFAAENAARIIERQGKKLLMCLAGDSLIEPFWPTGSGCARGFLGALDAAWMMRGFGEGRDPLELIEERESTLQLLSQTKPERLQKNYQTYSIDPSTRYLDIAEMVAPGDISHLYDRGQGPLEPTVIIKSGIASSTPRKKGMSRDKRYKTIGGIRLSKEYGSENKIDLEFLKSWGKGDGSMTSPPKVQPTTTSNKSTPHESKQRPDQSVKPTKLGDDLNQQKNSPKVQIASKDKETPVPFKPSQPSPSSPGSKTKSWFKRTPKSQEKENIQDVLEPSTPSTPEDTEEMKQISKPKSRLQQLTSLVRPSSPKKRPTTPKKTEKKGSPKTTTSEQSSPKNIRPTNESSPKSTKKDSPKIKSRDSQPKQTTISDVTGPANEKNSPKAQKKPSKRPLPKKTKSSPVHEAVGKEQTKKSSAPKSNDRRKPVPSARQRQDEQSRSTVNATIGHSQSLQDISIENRVNFFQSRINTNQNDPSPAIKVFPISSSPKKYRAGRRQKGREGTDYYNSLSGSDSDSDSKDNSQIVSKRKAVSMMDLSNLPGSELKSSISSITSASSVETFDEKSNLDGGPTPGDSGEIVEPLSGDSDVPYRALLKRGSSGGRPVTWTMDAIPEFDKMEVHKNTNYQEQTKQPKSTPIHRTSSTSIAQKVSTSLPKSEPLWQARYIASLNKCLETLRKENDIIEAKIALEIINTITSNVEEHPEDEDRFRRVRVSSSKFHQKVWNHESCRNFFLKSGWVEFDDFIVAPIGKSLAQSLRVISKHLSIVNHTIWSMQIELPQTTQERSSWKQPRKAVLKRQDSYVTAVVNDAIDRVAMAALKMRSTPSPPPIAEGDDDEEDEDDPTLSRKSSMSEERAAEVETMRAAKSARKMWLDRLKQETFTKPQVEWKPFLEVELYGDVPNHFGRRKHSGSSVGKDDRLSGNFDKIRPELLSVFQGEPSTTNRTLDSCDVAIKTDISHQNPVEVTPNDSTAFPQQLMPPVAHPSMKHCTMSSPSLVPGQLSMSPSQQPVLPSQQSDSPSQRPVSPSQRPVSLSQRPVSPSQRPVSPSQLPVSPSQRPVSPSQRPVSPSQRPVSPSQRPVSPSQRPVSPSLRPVSPSQRPACLSEPPVSTSPDNSQSSPPEKREILEISKDLSVKVISTESLRSLSEEGLSEDDLVESTELKEPEVGTSVRAGTSESESSNVASIRELWIKRTCSSDSVGPRSPNKDNIHSMQRSLTPSCQIHEDDHGHPPGRLTPDRPMSRSKTLPNMTPEPTSDKEVETEEMETEEVETEETNIPTSKYFTEGNKSTGLQMDRAIVRGCQENLHLNSNDNNNFQGVKQISSSQSVPNFSGELTKRDEERMVLEAGRLAHELARSMFS